MKKVFLRYDNSQGLDPLVHERLTDLDHYYNHFVTGWDFQDTKNLTGTLNQLVDSGVDWVVVSSLGNYLRRGSIDDRIINNCLTENSPMAGHLLDRQGYYNIDPQFFCLNLAAWDRVGRPAFEGNNIPTTFTSVAVERSIENFHDGYTPYWLRAGQGQKEYTVDRMQFGAGVVRAFLENCYTLINVDEEIRRRKICLYPEHNAVELKQMFTDLSFEPTAPILRVYSEEMRRQFDFENKHVYVLNSEPVIAKTTPQIDSYFGVCGGLKAVAILHKNGFTDTTEVNLFDISPPALEYQQYIVENWDGDFDHYGDVFNRFKDTHPDLPYAWRSWNSWEHEIGVFLTSGEITKEEFKTTWQRYIKLPITYTLVNLLDHSSVDGYFGQYKNRDAKNYYVWVSNAYRMEHTMYLYGEKWYDDKINNLKARLTEWTGSVYFESCTTLYKLK
jgi:hypothetical protein